MKFILYDAMKEAIEQSSIEMKALDKYLEKSTTIQCASCKEWVVVQPEDTGFDHLCISCSGESRD